MLPNARGFPDSQEPVTSTPKRPQQPGPRYSAPPPYPIGPRPDLGPRITAPAPRQPQGKIEPLKYCVCVHCINNYFVLCCPACNYGCSGKLIDNKKQIHFCECCFVLGRESRDDSHVSLQQRGREENRRARQMRRNSSLVTTTHRGDPWPGPGSLQSFCMLTLSSLSFKRCICPCVFHLDLFRDDFMYISI